MAESGVEESIITAENVSDWTRDLSSLILVQRARVLKLKSKKDIDEAEVKLESLESLLREAIIAHQVELKKPEDKTSRSGDGANQKSRPGEPIIGPEENVKTARLNLEQLKSRLREAIIDQGARVRKLEGKAESEEAVRRLESLKADHKAATGSDWSEVRAEGPILLTTNKVRGREILAEFRERLRELRRKGIIG